jgi:hypothetical protein
MQRLEFIRLGIGASAAIFVGALPGLGSAPADCLSGWAARHRAVLSTGAGGYHLVARPPRRDLPEALQELHKLADGTLHCDGRRVTGSFQGLPFLVELSAV